jgi:hypothetical protein
LVAGIAANDHAADREQGNQRHGQS